MSDKTSLEKSKICLFCNCKDVRECVCRERCGQCFEYGRQNCKCKVMTINPLFYRSQIK